MSQKSTFWGLCTLTAALIAIFFFFFNVGGTKDKIWHLIKPELLAQNAQLKNENERLSGKISSLKKPEQGPKDDFRCLRT